MDGKLSGGDIRQHQDQSDEQDNRGRELLIWTFQDLNLPPPQPLPDAPASTCSVWQKNGLRQAIADRREMPTSSTLPKYKTGRTPTGSPAMATLGYRASWPIATII